MNKVYHYNNAPYGKTVAILLEDASGYVMVTQFDNNPEIAVIHDLVVLKDRRGEGLGRELLLEAINITNYPLLASSARLSAEPGSWVEGWYKRHGFKIVGQVEEYGQVLDILERESEKDDKV